MTDTLGMKPARSWAIGLRHGLCLMMPVATLVYTASGPHRWYWAPLWLAFVALQYRLDLRASAARHAPVGSSWVFDALLYLLVGLQLANMLLMGRMIAVSGLLSLDAVLCVVFVGANSGYSAIVVAHELIHRKQRHMQLLGRLLLATVMYDHFFTEHLRGHHVRVGTPEDPATARFGETFFHFFKRTVPGQFKSAWRLETKRLGEVAMPLFDLRLLKSRVVRGLLFEWGLAGGFLLSSARLRSSCTWPRRRSPCCCSRP